LSLNALLTLPVFFSFFSSTRTLGSDVRYAFTLGLIDTFP
jgi:hypothetical protein